MREVGLALQWNLISMLNALDLEQDRSPGKVCTAGSQGLGSAFSHMKNLPAQPQHLQWAQQRTLGHAKKHGIPHSQKGILLQMTGWTRQNRSPTFYNIQALSSKSWELEG